MAGIIDFYERVEEAASSPEGKRFVYRAALNYVMCAAVEFLINRLFFNSEFVSNATFTGFMAGMLGAAVGIATLVETGEEPEVAYEE